MVYYQCCVLIGWATSRKLLWDSNLTFPVCHWMPTLASWIFLCQFNLKANKMLLVMLEDRWCLWEPPSYPKGGSCSSIVVLTSSLRHSYYVQLTAVISRSPLTSIIWPYLGLRLKAHQGHDIRKFKVALNPMYRICLNLVKSCISSCSSKFYNKKTFHRADFEI